LTEESGDIVRSGPSVTEVTPVLAAGVGARRGFCWALRAASFRLEGSGAGLLTAGIVVSRAADATVITDLLAGAARPAYGQLRVLGEDLTTTHGRHAVRARVGLARARTRPAPALRVRGLVDHATRVSRLPASDRDLLAASIMDRLALAPWATVPLRAAPLLISRRARLAAAAVHQPDLLLLDGLLDGLVPRDQAALADAIRDLARDTAIVAAGRDAAALGLISDQLLTLAQGVLTAPDDPGDPGWAAPGRYGGLSPAQPRSSAMCRFPSG
jgi:ABC-type branched-subunit amino acid transport system ATPase component